MVSKVKIPKQLYVTYQERNEDSSYEGGGVDKDGTYVPGVWTQGPVTRLGFLNAYEPTSKAFEKKQATQLEWTYHNYYGQNKIEDGVHYTRERDHGASSYRESIWHPWQVAKCQPAIWENEPFEGFRILNFVSRYRGNKLWRIQDPRENIEFEISTACLDELIQKTDIIKGEIIGKCLWKTNKHLILSE